MRLAALAAACLVSSFASAHDLYGVDYGFWEQPNRAAEQLALEGRLYRRFEAASNSRRLRAEMAYSEARIDALRRRLDDYDGINRFGTGNALELSADRTRLDLFREEMIRRDLQDQLILDQRVRRRSRIVHAEALQRTNVARTRAAAVGDGSITIVNH